MPTIAEIRSKYPQYSDMSDAALADALYSKFYSDMPRDAFNAKVGFSAGQPGLDQKTFDERFTGEPAQQPPTALAKAVEPFTSYPETYDKMNRESRDLMSEGVDQLQKGGVYDALMGGGKAALGGLGFVTSPINAALRTIAGKPVEENIGIPKEYTEFATSLALPMPKRIPLPAGKVASKAAPTSEELKAAYLAAKESPEVAAVSIKPEAMGRAADELAVKLNTEWLDPNLAPKTHYIMQKLQSPPEGATVTMQNVDSARRLLGKMAGRGDEEAAAAQIAKKELDKWIEGVKPVDTLAGDPAAAQAIMTEGRANYARGKLGDALDTKIAKAESQADATHSGMNLQNQLRQKVNQFLQNDESRGLTASERAALESFVKGTATENTLRFVGKWLGGGGGLGSQITAATSGSVFGPAGIAAPVVGYGIMKLANRLTANHANRLSEAIRANSPLGKQLSGPSTRFEETAMEFQVSPTPQNLARVSLAARNLSTNLKDAGITVSPNELLKSLQGPMSGRAEDQQP